MANYCNTSYVVEGNKQDIDSFYEMMMRLKNADRQLEPGHFGNTWLGFILEEFGENPEEYMCQGQWYDLTRDGDVLRFKAETAWEPCHQIRWMIEDKYPSLKFSCMLSCIAPSTNAVFCISSTVSAVIQMRGRSS